MAPTTRQSAAKGIQSRQQSAAKNSAGALRRNERPKPPEDDDSMDVDEPQIKLKTFDGKRFSLAKSVLSCSNALRTMIETSHNTSNNSQECINLEFVDGQTLDRVVEWWRIHRNPIDHRDATCSQLCSINISDSEKAFLNFLTEEQMLKLTNAANYLDIERLFDSCCRLIAKRWESKKVDELRALYNIKSDFSREEENQMSQESKRLGMSE